jgi:hypothetical protein
MYTVAYEILTRIKLTDFGDAVCIPVTAGWSADA